jgi:hypothetical protein
MRNKEMEVAQAKGKSIIPYIPCVFAGCSLIYLCGVFWKKSWPQLGSEEEQETMYAR